MIPRPARRYRTWRLATACALVFGSTHSVLPVDRTWAADCGASGNTDWSFVAATTPTNVTAGFQGLYPSAGGNLSLLSVATGSENNTRFFSGVILRRPVCFELDHEIGAPPSSHGLLVTGDNGFAYLLQPTTLATIWSRSLQRTGSTSDETSVGPPVVQVLASSNAPFRAARNTDVAIIGTYYPTSTTANRLYGLDAQTGNILWLANPTGSLLMDAIHGLTLDYARNSVYVTSDKHLAEQNTIWAMNTINGVKKWARDLGAIDATPVLAAGRVYVATRAGELYALDSDTGATLWQTTVVTGVQLIRLAGTATGNQTLVVVLDSGGALHAYGDDCGSFAPLWSFTPPAAKVSATPVFLGGFLYAGADDGKTWQVRVSDGVGNAYASVSASGAAASGDPLVLFEGSEARLIAHSAGRIKKLCVPWPDTPGDKAMLTPWKERPLLLGVLDVTRFPSGGGGVR
jgi:outer membrane protein assembly factor BamB